jgi:hypothetical protein
LSKSLERVTKRLVKDPPMQMVSMRFPSHLIEDLKEVASAKGFNGYQTLIRYYVSQNLREDLSKLDQPSVEKIAASLKARGVSTQVIAEALAAA